MRTEDRVHRVRLLLPRHRFRARTPPPSVEGFAGYFNFNRMVEQERRDWRSRHYEPVFGEGRHLEITYDRKGGRKEYHHATWKLKT